VFRIDPPALVQIGLCGPAAGTARSSEGDEDVTGLNGAGGTPPAFADVGNGQRAIPIWSLFGVRGVRRGVC